MLSAQVQEFIKINHRAVLTTHRSSGGLQMSIVTTGLYNGGVAHSTADTRAKYKNLLRNPACSLLVSAEAWRPYLVIDGQATLMSADNTDPEQLRLAFRDLYRSQGREHTNWEEYDAAMVRDHRVIIIVMADKVYGSAAE